MSRAFHAFRIVLAFGIATSGAGDTARLSVTIRNRGPRALTIEFGSGCQLGYQVLDSSGTIVSPVGAVCAAAITYLTLTAGEARTATFHWSGSRLPPDTPLPSGEYRVRGGLGIGELLSHASTPVPVVIQ